MKILERFNEISETMVGKNIARAGPKATARTGRLSRTKPVL